MTIEIRHPTDGEFEAVFEASCVAFGEAHHPSDVDRARAVMPLERIHVAFDDGKPVGVAAAYAFEQTIPGGTLPAAGISWVGVLPSHRRRGLLTRLMREQLDDVHANGEPLAILWASEASIYGRFGYGLATLNGDAEADKAGFAFRDDPGPAGSVRLVTADEARELFPPLYERVRTTRLGFLSRSPEGWAVRLADPEHQREGAGPKVNALLELDGEPAGFARYRIAAKWERGLPQGEVQVMDVIATSRDALRELWRYVFSIDLTSRLTASLDPASPLVLMTVEPRRLHVTLVDGLWLRLVDVAAALVARSYAAAGSVVIDVVDDFCDWNHGRFRAGEGAGPADDAPQLRLSAADLGSLYLGGFDAHRLHAAGRIEELAPGAVERAAELFRTPEPPFCPDHF